MSYFFSLRFISLVFKNFVTLWRGHLILTMHKCCKLQTKRRSFVCTWNGHTMANISNSKAFLVISCWVTVVCYIFLHQCTKWAETTFRQDFINVRNYITSTLFSFLRNIETQQNIELIVTNLYKMIVYLLVNVLFFYCAFAFKCNQLPKSNYFVVINVCVCVLLLLIVDFSFFFWKSVDHGFCIRRLLTIIQFT